MSNLQPTLENELVILRPLRPEDFEAMYMAANDPKIWELHQNPDRWKSVVFKEFFKDAINSKGAFAILDKQKKEIIGSSRYKLAENSGEAIEIGWTFLARDYWGGEYNKSFKSLMIKHAFKHFDYILFHVDHKNYRSQKAVIKLGAELLSRKGNLGHLHTKKSTGLTYILKKEGNT